MNFFTSILTFLVAVSPAIFAQNCTFTLHKPVIDGNKVCFAVSSPPLAQLTYSWDFDNDGTYDTTTTDSAVCHVYSAPDTYTAVVRVTDSLGCENSDSERVVIERRGYVFVPELLYTIDLRPYAEYGLLPNNLLDYNVFYNSFVSLQRKKSLEGVADSCFSIFLFYKNRFIGKFINYSPRFIKIKNNIILEHRYVCEAGFEDADILVDTLGNIVWQSMYLDYPIISKTDSLFGVFEGRIGGGGLPFPVNILSPSHGEGERHNVYILNAKVGSIIDSIIADESLSRTMIVGLFNENVSKFYFLFLDSLVGYNEHLQKQYTIAPIINFPPESVITFLTMPIFEQSREDGNIYIYAAYNGISFMHERHRQSFWNDVPESLQWTTVEAVCMDTFGNILWRQTTDSLRVSCFEVSPSGRYTLGYTETNTNFREIVLWNTQTNEILFKKEFPNYSVEDWHFIWATIFENDESGHALISVISNDSTLYFQTDGSELILDFSQAISVNFFPFEATIEIEDSTLKIYKIRW
jgi:hypothetical protein